LAVILEREEFKWFKPRKGQFQLFYKWGPDHPEYQPDFVAEGRDCIYMLEPKAANEMEDEQVKAKRDVGVKWCALASEYASATGEKVWQYALIPHDAIRDNMTIHGLAISSIFWSAPTTELPTSSLRLTAGTRFIN
jgi:type III restriction enzyme